MEYTKEQIDKSKLPGHIAIIMDGNGRWAKLHKKPRVFGHRNGVKAVREATESCAELGVGYLTLYAFSTENWSRPALEVNALMRLLVDTLSKEIKTLNKNNIRLRAIGDLSKLPKKTYEMLIKGIENTSTNTGMTLILALNYSGRWDISIAAKKIAEEVKKGNLDEQSINEDVFQDYLSTVEFPDPELLIRTSGEMRISNFLLWQMAYTEMVFMDIFWPDFRKESLFQAIHIFQHRERRFGKTSEQLKVT